MNNNEYSIICNRILSSTMEYIDTDNMKRYKIDKTLVPSNNAIYTSAVTNPAPITLAFTPAGTGKSALIKDRVHALEAIGVPSDKIMVLNMNIAKTKQMQEELPNVNVMTFSDFTHGIFQANYSMCESSDTASIANILRLQNRDNLTNEFINKLSLINPQDKVTLLTLFVNSHLQYVIDKLCEIRKSEYALESMICQNQIYYMDKNPYDIDSILINGVHNMPIPILCTILEYANMYGCNLFITGSPEETIYEFNMAYNNAMNVLSSYTQKHIDIIRLNQTQKMSDDIKNVLNMKPSVKISNQNVTAAHMTVNHDIPVKNMVLAAMGVNAPYLKDKLNEHQQVLILARSKADISDIKQVVTDCYTPLFPNLKILDLTSIQAPSTSYGTLMSKNYSDLAIRYSNGITVGQFFFELYNILSNEITNTESPYAKAQYESDKDNAQIFASNNLYKFGNYSTIYNVKDIIELLINIESEAIQTHTQNIKENTIIDISGADIILSTIHTATDIRSDNVIVFMKNISDKIDNGIYRVALSRANNTEYIIFANYGKFDIPHQKYLQNNII